MAGSSTLTGSITDPGKQDTFTMTAAADTGSTFTSWGGDCTNTTGDCSELFDYGTVVTLTNIADIGSSFTGWSGACTGTGNCVVTLDDAKAVTATFTLEEIDYKIYLPFVFR